MHIAFLITRGDAVGGATIHVRDMARALRLHGHQATVLIGEGQALNEFARHDIPCRVIGRLGRSIHPANDVWAVGQIVSALRQLRPDVVSAHTAKAGWLGRVASRLVGVPALFTPHGWAISDRISPVSGRVFRLAERAAAPLAQTIVNVCEAERRLAEFHRIAPSEKLAVIHNGVYDVPAAMMADPRRDPPRLVMVARLEEPKDHASLLRALAGLREMAWRLQLVGGGPREAQVRALAESLNLTSRIDFTGSTGAVEECMARAQAFVLTSRSEGFPRSILEAMRAGLPVIASDVGGVSEAVLNGATGVVVPRGDLQALRSGLAAVIGSPALRVRMGAAARQRYERNFTFQHMFRKTLSLYEEVLLKDPLNLFASPEGI